MDYTFLSSAGDLSAAVLLTLAFQSIPANLWGAFPYENLNGVFEPTLS